MKSVTVVTCYYKIPSKHSHDNYNIWIHNLLNNIKCNIIIFTSLDLFSFFENIQNINKNLKLKIIIKEFNDLDILKKYNMDFWSYQNKIDPQQNIGRNKECYILWNSKMNFIKEAIELNPFYSDKFVWNDIGSMRNNYFSNLISNYPLYNNISQNNLDIALLYDYDNKSTIYFQNESHLSGAIFGTSKDIFLKIIDLFYKYLDEYIQHNLFIGCDQQILSTIYIIHPELFNIINPYKNNMNDCIIDKWFYLYYYYIKNL
jgi:hypothetical protein